MKKKTAKEKCISCFFVRRDIILVAFVGNIAFLFFVVQKNATESTVMRVNNKRKRAHQMRAFAPKRVLWRAFFNTRLCINCACVLRVRRPLISDLYCGENRYSISTVCFMERIKHFLGKYMYTG